jgi:hypothetical protein
MKIHTKVVISLVTLMLAGCASTSKEESKSASKTVSTPQVTNQESRREGARAVLEYKRLGLRLIHSPMGQIEAIEATGYAPIWSASQNAIREANRVAELEAKKIINDFINDETITSGVTVTMISRNIEKAVDRKNETNLERDVSVSALTTDQEVDIPLTSAGGTNSVNSNRSDAVKIASELKTTITVNNKGILGGLYLVNSEVVDGGKSVRATYRWDSRGAQDRREIRDLMRK